MKVSVLPFQAIALAAGWSIVVPFTLWALAAIYIDCRIPGLSLPLTSIYALGIGLVIRKSKTQVQSLVSCFAASSIVLVWWFSLKPPSHGAWRPDSDRTAWAEVKGDQVIIHNLRNCDYQTETKYSNCWSDTAIAISQLRTLDLFFINWGLRWLDHTVASFQFADGKHIAFSVEPRFMIDQSYSAIRGFFRQYGLIFVVADERDLIQLRTTYRKHEEVYLYRTQVKQAEAQQIFLTYLQYLNQLKNHPEWYNALTRNCTTTMGRKILGDSAESSGGLNGSLDELLYKKGRLVTGSLPYPELKERQHLNTAAQAARGSSGFSAKIRAGRVGF